MGTNSAIGDLETALNALDLSPGSSSRQLEVLDLLESNKLWRPHITVDVGTKLLDKHKSKLGDQVWRLLERVFLASLDTGALSQAERCLSLLRKQFPKSNRVRVLEGQLCEANNDFDQAFDIYEAVLEEDKTNVMALKRNVCLAKGRGDTPGAIAALNRYLGVFANDPQAWQELSQLYIKQQCFKLAKFCLEELITLKTLSWLDHLHYAEVLHTIGGRHNFEQARRYFAQSIEINPDNNLRAFFGLCMSIRAIQSSSKSSERKLNADLALWAKRRILAYYRQHSPGFVALVQNTLADIVDPKDAPETPSAESAEAS